MPAKIQLYSLDDNHQFLVSLDRLNFDLPTQLLSHSRESPFLLELLASPLQISRIIAEWFSRY